MAAKSLKQLKYSILESINQFHITDDHSISGEWLCDKIDDINAVLIDEHMKAGLPLDGFYLPVCCIDVTCRRKSCVINGTAIYSGTVIWYSELPPLNEKIGSRNLRYVGRDTFEDNWTRMSLEGWISINGAQWTRNNPVFTIIGNEVYFKNLPTAGMGKICILGILHKPTTQCELNDELPYPTPDPYKLELRVKQDILSTFGIKPDEQQDSRDNVPQQQVEQPKQQQQ